MADGTDLDERLDDDTDPGAPVALVLVGPADSKHKAPRVERERPSRQGSLLGMLAGLILVALVASNVALWVRSRDEHTSSRDPRVVAVQARLSDRLDSLQASIEDLKGSVATVEQSVAGNSTAPIAEQLAALQARADALTACVNTYMDALAAWTRNIAATFVYNRC